MRRSIGHARAHGSHQRWTWLSLVKTGARDICSRGRSCRARGAGRRGRRGHPHDTRHALRCSEPATLHGAHDCNAGVAPRGSSRPGRYEGVITFPTTPPIDPATKGVRVMLEDAARVRILDAIIPGGFDPATGAGWKTNPAGTAAREPPGPVRDREGAGEAAGHHARQAQVRGDRPARELRAVRRQHTPQGDDDHNVVVSLSGSVDVVGGAISFSGGIRPRRSAPSYRPRGRARRQA